MQRRNVEGRRQDGVRRRRSARLAVGGDPCRSAVQERLERTRAPGGHEERQEHPRHPRTNDAGRATTADAALGSSDRAPSAEPRAPSAAGKSHVSAGRHQVQKTARQPSETSPPMMSTSSGPTKLLHRNWTIANDPPLTSTAGHAPCKPRHPLMVTTSHAGTISDTMGSWRPAMALSRSEGIPVTAAERQNRRADGAVRDRRRVGDQRQAGGIERREAEAHQECGGDRHRRAEAGSAFDEGAERERDEQRLNAPIGGQARDRTLDDLELSGLDGQVIEEDRVEDDPADGEQTVGRAVHGCRRPRPTGMPYTTTETSSAADSPASAAHCAFHSSTASATSSRTIGNAATSVLSQAFPRGSYICTHGI